MRSFGRGSRLDASTSSRTRADAIQQAYQTTGVPESFLLDREGIIVKRVIGAHDWGSPVNRALVERLLDETGKLRDPAGGAHRRSSAQADLAGPFGVPLVLAAGEEPATTLLSVDVAIRAPAGRSLLSPGPSAPPSWAAAGTCSSSPATPLRLTRILPDTMMADAVSLTSIPPTSGAPRRSASTSRTSSRATSDHPGFDVSAHGARASDRPPPSGVGIQLSAASRSCRERSGSPGPRTQLQALDSARTEPLEIARADGPVEDVVRLDTSGFGPVRAMPGEVSVRVNVEAVGSRTIAAVPIRLASATARALRPDRDTVRVRVSGASGRLAALMADSLFIVVAGANPSQPGRVAPPGARPAGVAARAEPDSVTSFCGAGRG